MAIKAKVDEFISDMKSLTSMPIFTLSPAKKISKDEAVKTRFLEAWNNIRYDFGSGAQLKKDIPIWILGVCHHSRAISAGSPSDEEEEETPFFHTALAKRVFTDFASRPQFTYRKNFPPIPGTDITSDTGWGCMLRTAQMMIAQGFILHFLGRDWRWYRKQSNHEKHTHRKIISWFIDEPNEHCPLSVHRLSQIGRTFGNIPGNWYGPNTVAYIMQRAVEEAKEKVSEFQEIAVYVAQDCTIYSEDVYDLCGWRDETEASIKDNSKARRISSDSDSSSVSSEVYMVDEIGAEVSETSSAFFMPRLSSADSLASSNVINNMIPMTEMVNSDHIFPDVEIEEMYASDEDLSYSSPNNLSFNRTTSPGVKASKGASPRRKSIKKDPSRKQDRKDLNKDPNKAARKLPLVESGMDDNLGADNYSEGQGSLTISSNISPEHSKAKVKLYKDSNLGKKQVLSDQRQNFGATNSPAIRRIFDGLTSKTLENRTSSVSSVSPDLKNRVSSQTNPSSVIPDVFRGQKMCHNEISVCDDSIQTPTRCSISTEKSGDQTVQKENLFSSEKAGHVEDIAAGSPLEANEKTFGHSGTNDDSHNLVSSGLVQYFPAVFKSANSSAYVPETQQLKSKQDSVTSVKLSTDLSRQGSQDGEATSSQNSSSMSSSKGIETTRPLGFPGMEITPGAAMCENEVKVESVRDVQATARSYQAVNTAADSGQELFAEGGELPIEVTAVSHKPLSSQCENEILQVSEQCDARTKAKVLPHESENTGNLMLCADRKSSSDSVVVGNETNRHSTTVSDLEVKSFDEDMLSGSKSMGSECSSARSVINTCETKHSLNRNTPPFAVNNLDVALNLGANERTHENSQFLSEFVEKILPSEQQSSSPVSKDAGVRRKQHKSKYSSGAETFNPGSSYKGVSISVSPDKGSRKISQFHETSKSEVPPHEQARDPPPDQTKSRKRSSKRRQRSSTLDEDYRPRTPSETLRIPQPTSSSSSSRSPSSSSSKAVIVLVPVRLGESSLNPIYAPCIEAVLSLESSIGIIGGKPKHSLFFVGFQGDYLLHLDPHYCRQADTLAGFRKNLHDYHTMSVRKINVKKIDPSCCLGFYCKDAEAFEAFKTEGQKVFSPPQQPISYPMCIVMDGRSGDHHPPVSLTTPTSESLNAEQLSNSWSINDSTPLEGYGTPGLLEDDVTKDLFSKSQLTTKKEKKSTSDYFSVDEMSSKLQKLNPFPKFMRQKSSSPSAQRKKRKEQVEEVSLESQFELL